MSTYIVTGGNSGLGFECARSLSQLSDATVILACRDILKGDEAAEKLRPSVGDIKVLALDLSSFESIRKFTTDFKEMNLPPLRALICNAGLQEVATPSKTKEGFESTFAVNHLGHFLLSQLMLPQISQNGRIIFVASDAHDPNEKTGIPAPRYVNADQVAHDFEPGMKAGQRRYSTSKLCNIYCTYEFARRLADSKDARLASIKVNAFDPGLMPGTGLARQYPAFIRFMWNYILPLLKFFRKNVHTIKESGSRLAQLASDPNLQANGKYFSDGREKRSSDLSYNLNNAKELWDSSLEMVQIPIEK